MIRFDVRSFLISLVLFFVLVIIAIFLRDGIIRPFLGDTLAVIWLYFLAKSVLNVSVFRLSLGVLLVSYCVEFAQYFHIVSILGLQDVKVARIVLGSTFDVMDLVAYTLGWVVILIGSRVRLTAGARPGQSIKKLPPAAR